MSSTGGGNTSFKALRGRLVFERFPWSFAELRCNGTRLGLAGQPQIGSYRKILPQHTIGVFVGAALPGRLQIAQIDFNIARQRKARMIGRFLAAVPVSDL